MYKGEVYGRQSDVTYRPGRVSLSELLEGNKESLGRIFGTIKPCNVSNKIGNKIVWTRCRGIPLSLWTVDCFKQLLVDVGSLVKVDDTTLNWENIEYARLKVRLAVTSMVKFSRQIQINDNV